MAFLFKDQEDEEEVVAQGDPSLITGAPGVGAPSPASGQQGANQTPGFVDAATYLEANRESALGTAGTVAEDLAGRAASLRLSAGELGEQYSGEIGAARYTPDQSIIDRAVETPGEIVSSPEDFQSFQDYWNAKYKGPTSFTGRQDYQTVAGDITRETERAGGVETEAGRTGMLEDLYPTHTRGMQSLDQLLLSGNPEAHGVISEAAAPFGELEGYLGEVSTGAESEARQAAEEAEALRTGTRERFLGEEGAVPAFGAELEQRVADARTAAQERTDTLSGYINERKAMTPEQAQEMGMTQEQYQDFLTDLGYLEQDWDQSVEFDPYFTNRTAEEAIRGETLASPEDYAREAAYEQLIGSDLDYLFPEGQEFAGTAPDILSQFDIGGAGGAASGQLSARDQQFIEAFGGKGLGIPGMIPNLPAGAPYYDEDDPMKFYTRGASVYDRNRADLDPLGQEWLDYWKPQLDLGYEGPAPQVHPPLPGTDGAPTQEEGRLSIDEEGNSKWWDGSQWTETPAEFEYRDADGNPGMMPGEASSVWKFNYDTGEYENTGYERPEEGPVGGTLPPGVIGV